MSPDRELLKDAAKAAGMTLKRHIGRKYDFFADVETGKVWNPLTDDGDALRLAVKLLFEIDMGPRGIAIRHATGIKILEAFNNDPCEATRRAITRAAAQIGKGMS
jgi:hypothetical protein